MSPTLLPTLNAVLNTAAALCLCAGYYFIKKKQIARHRAAMLTAFGISVIFLVTYVIHHARVGSVPYQGTGALRSVYFAVLIPHIILAAFVPFLAVVTIRRGLKNQIDRHRPIAKVTLPIWLYVSVTGVIVYFMLYGS